MSSANEQHIDFLLKELPVWEEKVKNYEGILDDMIQRNVNGEGPTEAAVLAMIDTLEYTKQQKQAKEAELSRLLGE